MKKCNRYVLTVVLLLASTLLYACSTWDKLNQTEKGAVIGGGSGAVVGSQVGGAGGAVVGGAVGAGAGGLIGHSIDDDDD